jgi:hypothetical protein
MKVQWSVHRPQQDAGIIHNQHALIVHGHLDSSNSLRYAQQQQSAHATRIIVVGLRKAEEDALSGIDYMMRLPGIDGHDSGLSAAVATEGTVIAIVLPKLAKELNLS